jgi:enterochelin esterase-like enzyme
MRAFVNGRPGHRPVLALGVLAIAAITLAAVLSEGSPAKTASPARTVTVMCNSPSLDGKLPAAVYLPAGYQNGNTRYPVVYFLHGLPAGPSSYTANSFVARAIAEDGRHAIVVAPQGARHDNDDREYLNWGPTEDWPKAISRDLPHCIDARFRTIATRKGRALIGLSAGGFGAFNIGLRREDTYAAVESWSGYFAATDPTGLRKLDLGSERANRRARVPRGRRLVSRLSRYPTLIAFYVGRQDSRFLNANILLDKSFNARGILHVFSVYPGGHSGSLWVSQAPHWLALALDQMQSAHS